MNSLARRAAFSVASHALHATIFGLEIASDLTPGLRMTTRRRLPHNMSAGILGAEVATWAAISPSLLPRPWWVTAANVAIGQAVGHASAATAAYGIKRGLRAIGKRPQDRVTARIRQRLHWVLGAGTVAATAFSAVNQGKQARMVNKTLDRGPAKAAFGAAVGTAGYGTLLLAGELIQISIDRLSHQLGRWVPALVAWPLVTAAFTVSGIALSDRVVLRRFLRNATARAQQLNRTVFPGTAMPWEPERSGSPWSYEAWTAVGLQGRAVLARGPRARDINAVMETTSAKEPIRIYIGLIPGRNLRGAARQALAEMERTGAFRRESIIIQLPSGSGWLNDWGIAGYEFLTHGNCATISVQYSFVPSAFSYVIDKETPKQAARELIDAVRFRLDDLPADARPKFYLAGESLGAYAIMDNFTDLDDLLEACDGAVFTGPPRITEFPRSVEWDPGSLERLPTVDGGRHVRFAATAAHMGHDAFGSPYTAQWQRPRVVVAQHASDAIVWWDLNLAICRPGWMSEPQPETLYADTFQGLSWAPAITFWQIGLDQINSLNVPGGHGHNYHEETFWYWDSVLGSQAQTRLTPRLAQRMAAFVIADQRS